MSSPPEPARKGCPRRRVANRGNFLRTLATPDPTKDWSLTSLKEKLIKIGAKDVSHGRCVAFQMAEVDTPKNLLPTSCDGRGNVPAAGDLEA